jgi:hypothetical protein
MLITKTAKTNKKWLFSHFVLKKTMLNLKILNYLNSYLDICVFVLPEFRTLKITFSGGGKLPNNGMSAIEFLAPLI